MKKTFIFLVLLINIFGSLCFSQINTELKLINKKHQADSLLNINSKKKNRFKNIPPTPPPPAPAFDTLEEMERSRIADSIFNAESKEYNIEIELST